MSAPIRPHARWTEPAAYQRPSAYPRLLPAPSSCGARITLYALRRIGAHGLGDAQAASMMLRMFGLSFRRPLVLLRTVMLELSRSTARPIMLAPCCCGRITPDEARLLAVLRHAGQDEPRARRHLGRLAANRADNVLCAAGAYGMALTDLGRPLTFDI